MRERLELWLAAHRRGVLIGLALLAAAFRVVYFVQLDAGPLIALHRLGETDMSYYDAWGRSLAAGDWLSRGVGVPMHPWHHDVAQAYLRAHPERRGEFARTGDPDAAVWREWLRPGQFYQDPLYAYLIGLTYRAFGPEPRVAFVWQLLLGVGSVCLIWSVARRLFGDAAAAVAGALAVACAPLMYYELLLLRESTMAFAGLLIVWLAVRAFESERLPMFAGLGAAAALAFTLKSIFLVVLIGLPVGMITRRRGWLSVAAFVAGAAVPLVPFAARNVAVGVSPFAMASSGPLTFALSNAPGYVPLTGFAVDRPQLARVLGETDGTLRSVVVDTLRSQTAGGYLRLLWEKWDLTWRWLEIPNNDDFYYMRAQVPVLRWLPVTFYAIAPLALVGLIIGLGRLRDAWPLYLLVVSLVASLVLFYVLGRFRIALVAAVLPFAGHAVMEMWRWIGTAGRQVRGVVAVVATIALLLLVTGRALPPDVPLIRPDDWMIPYVLEYGELITKAMEAGDTPRALDGFNGFFAYEPSPDDLDPLTSGEIPEILARMHDDCGELYRKSGQSALAATHAARAAAFRHLGARQ